MQATIAPIGAHARLQRDREHGQLWLTCLDCGAQWHDDDAQEQVSEGDGSCEETADESATHWSYGSGMTGCLYDGGPGFAETKTDAIEAALSSFFDLSEGALACARAGLEQDGIYYFPSELCAGADYVEITELDGPCPDDDA